MYLTGYYALLGFFDSQKRSEEEKDMKKWVAVLLASVLALNMVACDMGELSEEDAQYIAQVLDDASAGIEDEIENGDLETRWEEFESNLNLDVLSPENLHWEDLTLEDYEALGIDVADLEEAGLVLDELGLDDLDPADFDITELGVLDLQSLGLGDITLDDLAVDLDLSDLNPSELFLFLTSLSEDDLAAIGLDGLDLSNPDLSNVNLEDLDLSALESFLGDMGIDPVDLVLSNIDPKSVDLNNPMIRSYVLAQLEKEGIDLAALGIDFDDIDLNAIDLEKLGIDLNNLDLDNLDISKLDLSAIDLDSLGIKMEDIKLENVDLNNPMVRDYILSALEEQGIDLESLGIDLEDIDLNAIDLEKLGLDLNDLDFENLDLSKLDLSAIDFDSLGIKMEDINFENVDLNNPMIKEYIMGALQEQGFDLAALGIDLDDIDLNAIDLEKLGIDLNDLNLNTFDITAIDPSAIDLEQLGISLEDIDLSALDLNNPMIKDYIQEQLDAEGIDLEAFGVSLDDLDLNNPFIKGMLMGDLDVEDLDLGDLDLDDFDLESLGIDLDDIDLSALDLEDLGISLSDLDLEDVSLEDLGIDIGDLNLEDLDLNAFDLDDLDDLNIEIFLTEEFNPEDLNLGNPLVQDFILSQISLNDLDLSDIDLGELPIEELDLTDLEILGLDDIDIGDLDLSEADLEDLEDELADIDLENFDFGDLTIGDLAAMGVTFEDLEQAGLIPADLIGDITVLLDGIAEYTQQNADTDNAEEKKEPAKENEKKSDKIAEEKAAEEEINAELTAIEEERETEKEALYQADNENITYLPEEEPSVVDDFYGAVDFYEAQNAQIPVGYSQWTPLVELAQQTDQQIKKIVQDAQDELADADQDSPEYRIGALYETLLDMDARNEAGCEPIQGWLKAYEDAKSLEELEKADMKLLKDTTVSGMLSIAMDYDPADSSHYVIMLDSCLHAPDKEMMLNDDLEQFRDQYLIYLGESFRAAGFDDVDAVLKGAGAYALQGQYEEHTLEEQEWYDPKITENLFTQAELEKKFKNFPIADYLEALGIDEANGYGPYKIPDLEAMEFFDAMYTEDHMELFKDNAMQTVIDSFAPALNEELYVAKSSFEDALNGVSEPKPFELKTVNQVNGLLPTDVAMAYTDRYCSEDTKEEVEQITEDLIDAYYGLIEDNTWMEKETKEKAMEKLDKLNVKVAYPDYWVNYQEDAKIRSTEDGGSAFDNYIAIQYATRRAMLDACKDEVDPDEWTVIPQTVNAFYNPSQNEICICAAILQGAYYDPDADYATNLGGIGYVIGHEISHAFDADGAQYDADGNLNQWWTEGDWERFEEQRDRVIDYYDHYEVIPDTGVCVNGELTVTENMADLGAAKAVERICDGDQEMFEAASDNIARIWTTKINSDALKMRLNNDVHAPSKARVNVPLQMCDLFYDTFDVDKGDGMYVDPKDRIGIW